VGATASFNNYPAAVDRSFKAGQSCALKAGLEQAAAIVAIVQFRDSCSKKARSARSRRRSVIDLGECRREALIAVSSRRE